MEGVCGEAGRQRHKGKAMHKGRQGPLLLVSGREA